MENVQTTNVAADEELNQEEAVEIQSAKNVPSLESLAKEPYQLQRTPFKLKEQSNGNILTIHHTIKENEKLLRIVMCVACFDYTSSQLVAIDKRGTVFVFDLCSKRFWRNPSKLPRPSAIVASRKAARQYVAGNKDGCVALIDIDLPVFLYYQKISDEAIHEISFPGQPVVPKHLALLRSGRSAVLMDLETFTCTHRLDFDSLQMSLKFASFIPQFDTILTCFTTDIVHLWSAVTLEVVRVVDPIKLRDKHLQLHKNDAIPELYLAAEENDLNCAMNVPKNLCDGLIANYAYQYDGSKVAFATWDNYLLIFSAYTFEMTTLLHLKDFNLIQLQLLAKPNDHLIMGLTDRSCAVLLDTSNSEFKLIVELQAIRGIRLSFDCKYLSVFRSTGDIGIWSMSHLIDVLRSQQQCMTILRSAFKQTKPLKVPSNEAECRLQDELKKLLTPQRLQQILREFHCYPAKYRTLIWCSLLQLPNNKTQYQDLLQMGTPLIISQKSRSIQLKNDTLKRALVKCWSCLGHWCKVLGHSDILPGLIFPFVKIFQQNALITFEICATLIINQFQLFFEYHPLEPTNYLGLCANLLQHFDKTLLDFLQAKDVTPNIYAWSMLKTSFSEVLDEDQWLCLWDNVLSAPPYFLVFVVIAYNMLQKQMLIRLTDKFIIEHFYHEQNPLDVRKLIAKAYKLQEKCPPNLHPQRYMQGFRTIPANVYPKFLKFPNQCLLKYEEQIGDLHRVNSEIDARMRNLELEELQILRRLENGLRQEEHTKRMKEIEQHYQDTLKREEERISCQRKILLLYQKEIRQRKGQVVAALQESEQRKSLLQKERELNCLQNSIEQERLRNDVNLMWAEEELHNHDVELLAQRSQSQYLQPSLSDKYQEDIQKLFREQKRLQNDLKMISSAAPVSRTKQPTQISVNSLDNLERQLDKFQTELLVLTGNKHSKSQKTVKSKNQNS